MATKEKKRSMADLPPAKRTGVSKRDLITAKQQARFDELLDDYNRLKRLGRAPSHEDAVLLIEEECGFSIGVTTFKREAGLRLKAVSRG